MAKKPMYPSMADKAEEKAEPAAEKKAEEASPSKEKAESKSVDGGTPEKSMAERHAEARKALHKTHEAERKDLHGNVREMHRSMEARHEKAIGDMNSAQDAEMAGGAPEGAGPAPSPMAPEAGGMQE